MSFIFMVLHWPEPGHRDALSGLPGCISVDPPYLTDDGTCLGGISKWESRQAFSASGITLRPPGKIAEGAIRPWQRFLLQEAGTGRSATEENDSSPCAVVHASTPSR